MTNELTELQNVLGLTDSIISKNFLSYLTDGTSYQVRNLTLNSSINWDAHTKIYHLKRFVYDENENFLNKLITVVNVAYSLRGSVLTAIVSNGKSVEFFVGILAKEAKGGSRKKDKEALMNAFEGTILGNFSGSEISDALEGEKLKSFVEHIDGNAICSVSVVPSLRDKKGNSLTAYVQGIENLIDSLKGKKYTLLTIADPVTNSNISEIRHGYESVYNYLVPLHKVVETRGTSESVQNMETETRSYVQGITEGITRTQSKSESVNYTNGFNLGLSFVVQAGFNHSKNSGTSHSDSVSEMSQDIRQQGDSKSINHGTMSTTNESTQISVENRIIKSMLDKIEKNMKRIDECEGYGAFNVATYVLANDKETALNTAGNFASLMKGDKSSVQISAINCWERKEETSAFDKVLEWLGNLAHPEFYVAGLNENRKMIVTPAMMLSGPELTVQLGFPKKSINGMTVLPMHPFGRNIDVQSKDSIMLGKLQFMGCEEKQDVQLDINSLASHTFITGSTGSGKSNAVFHILDELQKKQVKFMVVEPAKGEYKRYFGNREDVHVYGTNAKKTELLRINPFAFAEDIHVLEHIDRLIEVFNVCWPMYAAMPAVLKEAIEEAYLACGWDLIHSENKYGKLFPTFIDLQKSLELVINNSAYDEEVKSNYKGSLLTRVRSLANGISGQIFSSAALSDEQLFEENIIVDMSRVGSMETKALIMGILVIRLQEYRMSSGCINSKLHHVTVLEEAHNLLKKTSSEQSMEGSNVVGKSVEMISNAIAEMRSFGEGFIIADQAPGLLDMSVIRNTNTKIILRTPEYTDRLLVGRAAGLNEGQIEELAKLPLGVAAVYQNNWLEAVLCKISKFSGEEKEYLHNKLQLKDNHSTQVSQLVGILMKKSAGESLDMNMNQLSQLICEMDIASQIKIKALQAVRKNGSCTIQDISPVMHALFYSPNIKKEAEITESIEAWKSVIIYANDFIFDNLDTDAQNKILESILCEEVESCGKSESYLEMWNGYLKGEVM